MAYRHRYVDPNATGSATGTSWANAYTSLNTAENTEDDSGDIRATGGSNEIVVFHCRASSGTADSTAVTISGWTTDSGGYIVIVCDATGNSYGGGETDSIGGRHSGVWSTDKYRLQPSNATALDISEDYVRVDGLQLFTDGTPTANERNGVHILGLTVGNNAVWLSGSIVRGHTNGTYYQYGVFGATNCNLTIWNCIVYGIATITSCRAILYSTASIYSCTTHGGQYGIRATGSGTIKNCYAAGSASGDYSGGTLTTCASSDSTGSVGLRTIAYSTANFANVTAGSEDLHLVAGSALIGAGTDTSGESAPLNFTVDIAGITRS